MKKKIMVAIVMMGMLVAGGGEKVNAASSYFSLRYVKGAPTSENVTSWSKTVTTTFEFSSVYLESITGGCTVRLKSSNGIEADKTTTSGSVTSNKVKIGQKIKLSASIVKTGVGATQKVTGDFVY